MCSVDGCDREPYTRGICNAHWQQERRGKPFGPIRPRNQVGCKFEGCEKKHRGRGYCQGHLIQIRKGTPLRPLLRQLPPGTPCAFDTCDREAISLGFCNGHYLQLHQGRTMAPLYVPVGKCSYPGCGRPHETGGYCSGHRGQLRLGGPLRPIKSLGPCEKCGLRFDRSHHLQRYCSEACRPDPREWIPSSIRREVYERDDYRCQLCGSETEVAPVSGEYHPWAPSLDHIVPKSRGGSDRISNLRTAHRWCNTVRREGLVPDEDFWVSSPPGP